MTAEDESKAAKDVKADVKAVQRQPSVRHDIFQNPSALSPAVPGPSTSASPAFSRASSLDHDRETSVGPENSRRVLRIKRLV